MFAVLFTIVDPTVRLLEGYIAVNPLFLPILCAKLYSFRYPGFSLLGRKPL